MASFKRLADRVELRVRGQKCTSLGLCRKRALNLTMSSFYEWPKLVRLNYSSSVPWSFATLHPRPNYGLTSSTIDHRFITPGFKPRPGYVRRVFHISLCLIAFGYSSVHLAHHVYKCGRKTGGNILIFKPVPATLWLVNGRSKPR